MCCALRLKRQFTEFSTDKQRITGIALHFRTIRRVALQISSVLFVLGLPLVLSSCASQRAPQGGPEDKTPPRVTGTYPDSATTNFHDNRLRLIFDKYMSIQTLSSALFFSPALTDYDIDWDGYKEVEIVLYEPLKENRTHSVTVTTALKDYHGNALAKSYSFAFSTGAVIDSGLIEGLVYDAQNRPAKGTLVMGYHLPDNLGSAADTLNPARTKPDYIAQTDPQGRFSLRYLPTGKYRIIAITDKNQNLLYNIGAEDYGVPADSVVSTGTRNLHIKLAIADTASVQIQSVKPANSNLLTVRFDRDLVYDSVTTANFALFDSTALKPVPVFDFYTAIESKTLMLYLSTDSLREKHFYELRVNGIPDKYGNLARNQRASFEGLSEPDTAVARFRRPFADSTKGLLEKITQEPEGRTLPLSFTNPISRSSFLDAFSLSKTTNSTSTPLAVKAFFKDSRNVGIRPETGFELGGNYVLRLDHRKIRDVRGRLTLDTVIVLHFQIAKPEQFGGIEGTIETHSPGAIVVTAQAAGQKQNYYELIYATPEKLKVPFEFKEIPEGSYLLSAYQLRRQEPNLTPFEKWDGGQVFPYRPAERFVVGEKEIRVRNRWVTADIKLMLP